MTLKKYITALVALLSFTVVFSGCTSGGSQAKGTADSAAPAQSISDSTSVINGSGTANPEEGTKQSENTEDKDFYSGLNQFETSFKLENYPVAYKSKYSVLRASEGCMTQQELEKAGSDIDEAVEKLQKYLGTTLVEEWDSSITYFIRPGELPRVVGPYSKPVAFLSPESGKIPMYAHETTHLLAGCKVVNSTWMSEGLAVYLNTLYSAYPTWPQFEKDLDSLAKERLDNGFDRVINFEDEAGYTFHDPTQPDGEAYYILSGSFVKYIIVNADIKKYMAAYKSYDAGTGLENETGKSLKAWKDEWIKSLKKIKDK